MAHCLHPRDLERIHDERSGKKPPSAVPVTGLGDRGGQPGERLGLIAAVGDGGDERLGPVQVTSPGGCIGHPDERPDLEGGIGDGAGDGLGANANRPVLASDSAAILPMAKSSSRSNTPGQSGTGRSLKRGQPAAATGTGAPGSRSSRPNKADSQKRSSPCPPRGSSARSAPGTASTRQGSTATPASGAPSHTPTDRDAVLLDGGTVSLGNRDVGGTLIVRDAAARDVLSFGSLTGALAAGADGSAGTISVVDDTGHAKISLSELDGDIHLYGADVAEDFDADAPIEPGTVVVARSAHHHRDTS